jgi:hypothetical protein
MDYLLISTAVAGIVFFLAFFLRSKREAREENQVIGPGEGGLDDLWREQAASSALLGIFSSEDQQFIVTQASAQLTALFRRERKRLALRWIERQKCASADVMRRHREETRSAADLRPSSELSLFFRYGKLRFLFEVLAVSVWLVGPEGLRGLAERSNAVLRGIENVRALGGSKRSVSV